MECLFIHKGMTSSSKKISRFIWFCLNSNTMGKRKVKLICTATFVVLALLISGCKSGSGSGNESSDAKRPNIVFIITDDMYRDMFNCLPEGKGKNLTPNLDRLAAEGTLMLNTYVASPVCTPSRYNVLTGTYASRASNESFLRQTERQEGQTVIHWNTFVTEADKALPQYLRELGYSTGMAGKNHLARAQGLYNFPDYWADPRDPAIKEKLEENYQKAVRAVKNIGFDFAGGVYNNNPNFIGLGELAMQNMEWITEAGLTFIDQHHEDPFFLYFATTIPHLPVEPERSWKADPLTTARGFLESAPNVQPPRETLEPRIAEAGLSGNNKELVLWLDDAIGALLEKLEEHNVLENTIIMFFNDHGQKAKGSLYQDGVLSPSIIWKSGGFACGSTVEDRIQNIDFAPTILELAGIKTQVEQFDGRSFTSILEGKKSDYNQAMFFELGYSRAIIKGDFKYLAVRYPEFARNMTMEERKEKLENYNTPRIFKKLDIVTKDYTSPFSHFSLVPGGELAESESYGRTEYYFDPDQLYNLIQDPDEQINLAGDPAYSEILNELKEELRKHLETMPGKFEL